MSMWSVAPSVTTFVSVDPMLVKLKLCTVEKKILSATRDTIFVHTMEKFSLLPRGGYHLTLTLWVIKTL